MFTAVIQPPLILFCAVPGAYWLFHGGKVGNLKDLLINCGYPLIERFPLMLGTAGGVLLIGLIRWYFGMSHRTTARAANTDQTTAAPTAADAKSVISGIAAKLNSLLGRIRRRRRRRGSPRPKRGAVAAADFPRPAGRAQPSASAAAGPSAGPGMSRPPLDDARGRPGVAQRRTPRPGDRPGLRPRRTAPSAAAPPEAARLIRTRAASRRGKRVADPRGAVDPYERADTA